MTHGHIELNRVAHCSEIATGQSLVLTRSARKSQSFTQRKLGRLKNPRTLLRHKRGT